VDSEAVLAQIKGRPVRVVIEYVRDGASFRAVLLDSFTYINLNLAGVQAPRVNAQPKTATGKAHADDMNGNSQVLS
jgi:hypothetical protein